tara:strand:+ start:553 stop:951 length:399 start_codon:yes stop_codon:yes gene_type:complete
MFSLMQVNLIAQEKMEKFQTQFGEIFIVSNSKSSTIGNLDESVEIEIIDFIEEWGYDATPEDENRNYYSDVQYTLGVQVKDLEKRFSFYSSDIKQKDSVAFDFGSHKILILSDKYTNSSALIEMIITKKDNK